MQMWLHFNYNYPCDFYGEAQALKWKLERSGLPQQQNILAQDRSEF